MPSGSYHSVAETPAPIELHDLSCGRISKVLVSEVDEEKAAVTGWFHWALFAQVL